VLECILPIFPKSQSAIDIELACVRSAMVVWEESSHLVLVFIGEGLHKDLWFGQFEVIAVDQKSHFGSAI
jgi:hypothetical protein